MAKRFVYFSAGILSIALFGHFMTRDASAQMNQPIVGVGAISEGDRVTSIAVSESGETMWSLSLASPDGYPPSPWAPGTNVFGNAGSGRKVGAISQGFIVAEDGGVFQLTESAGGPILEIENVFDVAGKPRQAGEVFIGLDVRGTFSPSWIFAVTNQGRVFRRNWVSSQWQIVGELGPVTAVAHGSWGAVKSRYHN
ncbi:MAG: hypothetical protein HYR73_01075 [Candidatus Eisenbacteria bacterium]|nr:hypothetical protein [Candidatus Eisenbacteria bacterium]